MTRIDRVDFPKPAKIWENVQTGDFIDGYSVRSDLTPRAAAEAAFQIPGWAVALMALRNVLVRPFGIKTDAINSKSALFPTTYESESEIVIGADDRHLDFRISIMQREGHIHMATWVHRKNLFGRLYLMAVLPFHILIVRGCMKRVARPA